MKKHQWKIVAKSWRKDKRIITRNDNSKCIVLIFNSKGNPGSCVFCFYLKSCDRWHPVPAEIQGGEENIEKEDTESAFLWKCLNKINLYRARIILNDKKEWEWERNGDRINIFVRVKIRKLLNRDKMDISTYKISIDSMISWIYFKLRLLNRNKIEIL